MRDINSEYKEQFESLRDLLSAMVSERSVDSLLKVTVDHLAANEDVVAAAIWLIRPGDICDSCEMASVCPDQALCLHLLAAAGSLCSENLHPDSHRPLRVRIPLGVGCVGRVAAWGEVEAVDELVGNSDLPLIDPGALDRSSIGGFLAVPMNYRGNFLGTLGLFTVGAPPQGGGLLGRRVIANIAAGAMANARAFEEIERLRHKLELENEYLREEISVEGAFHEMVGRSPALQGLQRQIQLVAPTDASVLILGESGTGKELVAREIHKQSNRSSGPLIKIGRAHV